ncbi:MAG: endonuclease I family protein [Bacillota bacterium]
MKKLRLYGAVLVIILGGLYVGMQYVFQMNLLTMFVIDDTEAPVIDVSGLPSKALLNGDYAYDISDVTCNDDYDLFCEVEISGDIDTSNQSIQQLIIKAVDFSGNERVIEFSVEVVTDADGSFYIPTGYYDGIEGLTGDALKDALNDIITGHTEYPYTDDETDVWDILKLTDEDPDNPNNVILFYTGLSWPKTCQDGQDTGAECETDDGTVVWNREHIWSKSRGDFEIKEGTTTVLDMGAHTDLHHLVPAERTMNSIKNNRLFEDCFDGDDDNVVDRDYGNYTCNEWEFEPRDEVKGDVARMLFYMAVRYEGEPGDMVDLEVINDADPSKDSKLPYYGDLDDLLRWHEADPVSEWEILRNQTIYEYQGNRNPFIDDPDLVERIWGESDDYQ